MTKTARISAAVIMASVLSGCFTGIESTPTITDREVRKQQPKETPEDSYLKEIEELQPTLAIGSPLIVTDPKIRLVFEPGQSDGSVVSGDTLRLCRIDEATTFDGQQVAVLEFSDNHGTVPRYRTSQSKNALQRKATISIPFTVDLTKVEAVRRKMNGQTYYLITASRYDESDNLTTGRRFVPVKVVAVEPGNEYYPIRLELTDDLGDHLRLYMSVDSGSIMPRRFSTLFSLSDPRLRYPAITDANWALITEGKVAQGMTRDECRLAIGKPDNVDRQPGYSSLHELWTYNDGKMLVFEDGILQSFRQ